VGVTHVVSCGHVWGRIPLCGICRWAFECLIRMCAAGGGRRGRRWGAAVRRQPVGARVWRDASSVGARAGASRECVPFCDILSL
jgi:hypothetical protein